MHRVLIIPDESYPAHQSFMTEVFSKEDDLFQSVFLMRSPEGTQNNTQWNKSKVYLFPYLSKFKLINIFTTYFCIDLRFIYLIPRIIFNEKITIIQVRDLTFPLIIALFFKFVAGKKVVYQKSYPMEYSRIEAAMNKKHKFPSFLVKVRKLENIILHKLFKFTDAVLPISHYMADNLYRDYQVPREKMFPFGMGFNFSDFPSHSSKIELDPETFSIIYVGTLDKKRQFDVLIQGISLTRENLSGHKVLYEFVGGTDEEIVELQNLADELCLGSSCIFSGYIRRDEAYRKIDAAHIGISWFGSHVEFHDACPTKMMEYFAKGLPILAVDTVYLHRDIIKETHAGVLCKIDPQDVAEKITYLISNYSLFKEKALKTITYIEQNFSYEAMRPEIKQLYDRL